MSTLDSIVSRVSLTNNTMFYLMYVAVQNEFKSHLIRNKDMFSGDGVPCHTQDQIPKIRYTEKVLCLRKRHNDRNIFIRLIVLFLLK